MLITVGFFDFINLIILILFSLMSLVFAKIRTSFFTLILPKLFLLKLNNIFF